MLQKTHLETRYVSIRSRMYQVGVFFYHIRKYWYFFDQLCKMYRLIGAMIKHQSNLGRFKKYNFWKMMKIIQLIIIGSQHQTYTFNIITGLKLSFSGYIGCSRRSASPSNQRCSYPNHTSVCVFVRLKIWRG